MKCGIVWSIFSIVNSLENSSSSHNHFVMKHQNQNIQNESQSKSILFVFAATVKLFNSLVLECFCIHAQCDCSRTAAVYRKTFVLYYCAVR